MRNTLRSTHSLTALLTVLTCTVAGCSLITTFDRSKIKQDLPASDAGADAKIGDGGFDAGNDAAQANDAALPDSGKDGGLAKHDSGADAAMNDGGDTDSGVECHRPAECPGTDNECQMRTCSNTGKCGLHKLGSGVSTATQTAGDCKRTQCDGNGHSSAVNDDGDVPTSASGCATYTCSAGVASSPNYVVSGNSCSVGGKVCDGAGNCVGCLMASDCGTDTECITWSCTGHVCGSVPASAGKVLTAQVAGDCKQAECDAAGNITQVAKTNDLPNDNQQCTTDTCSNAGMPLSSPVTTGTACTQAGGHYCSSTGTCLECLMASTCPGTDTFCQLRTCSVSGSCGLQAMNMGLALPSGSQSPNDCLELQCDNSGVAVAVNLDSDLPVSDGKECTIEACSNGMKKHNPVTAGTHCATDTKLCDNAGNCGGCLVEAACTGNGNTDVCIDQACVAAGSLTSVSVTPTLSAAGAVGTVTIIFTTHNKWPADGSVVVDFPAGFDASGATFQSTTAAGTLTVTPTGKLSLKLARVTGTETGLPATVTIVLANVKNPQVAGTTGSFAVSTKTATPRSIDTGTGPGFAVTGAIMLDTTAAGATSIATVAFITSNPWPKDGSVDVLFPSDFDVSTATFGTITGPDGGFMFTKSGPTLTVTRDGTGADMSPGAVSILFGMVLNPATMITTGGFTVTTNTATPTVIDTSNLPGIMIQ